MHYFGLTYLKRLSLAFQKMLIQVSDNLHALGSSSLPCTVVIVPYDAVNISFRTKVSCAESIRLLINRRGKVYGG